MGLRDVSVCMLILLGILALVSSLSRPNVVIILADDLGWNDVSFHGSGQIPTPNLDTLAYDGILLSQYYVQPICTPSRSALMTGRHPIHLGMQQGVIISAQPYGLGLNEKLLPQYLKELGYQNHIVGKWHLGFYDEAYTPLERGFDSHYGYFMGAEDYFAHISGGPHSWHLGFHSESYCPTERGFDSHYGYFQGCEDYYDHTYAPEGPLNPKAWGLDFRRNKDIIKTAFGQYSTTLFTSEAERIIADHDTSTPMFLYLAQQAVHSGNGGTKTPLEAPWKYLSKFSYIKNEQRRRFAAMVSALDDSVGNVTKALHARGMLNNTIILFSTDNGGPAAGFDYNDANNWPLRGIKESLWEGGVRGNGFIWSPLLQHTGYTFNGMIQIFDWLPTILGAVGYDTNKLDGTLDGINQWEVLSQNQTPLRIEMLHNIDEREGTAALRVGDMKVVISKGGATKGWSKWYSPDQFYENFAEQDRRIVTHVDPDLSMEGDPNYNPENTEQAPSHMFANDLTEILVEIGRKPTSTPRPIVVECGPRPANASTNCEVGKQPCMFNITADPCEFNNLAPSQPQQLQELLWRLAGYNATSVTPRNKPIDPAGLPCNHEWLWVPWVKEE